jgi:hypothetical protein
MRGLAGINSTRGLDPIPEAQQFQKQCEIVRSLRGHGLCFQLHLPEVDPAFSQSAYFNTTLREFFRRLGEQRLTSNAPDLACCHFIFWAHAFLPARKPEWLRPITIPLNSSLNFITANFN